MLVLCYGVHRRRIADLGVRMSSVRAIPILLSILVGLLISAVAWEILRSRSRQNNDATLETSDGLLLGLLVLAALVSSIFAAYILLRAGL